MSKIKDSSKESDLSQEESRRLYDEYIENIQKERKLAFQEVVDFQIAAGIKDPVEWGSWNRFNSASPEIIRVLVDILSDPKISMENKSVVTQYLSYETAYPYFNKLIELFKTIPSGEYASSEEGLRMMLVNNILHQIRHHKELSHIFYDLASDENSGGYRSWFLEEIRRKKDPKIHELIRRLALHDSDISFRDKMRNSLNWKSYWVKHDPVLWQSWEDSRLQIFEALKPVVKKLGKKNGFAVSGEKRIILKKRSLVGVLISMELHYLRFEGPRFAISPYIFRVDSGETFTFNIRDGLNRFEIFSTASDIGIQERVQKFTVYFENLLVPVINEATSLEGVKRLYERGAIKFYPYDEKCFKEFLESKESKGLSV